MKIIRYPDKNDWTNLLKRPVMNVETLRDVVNEVLSRIQAEGDKAVIEYEERFDKVKLESLAVSESEMKEAEALVSEELKAAILLAQKNIQTFHSAQRFEGKKEA